MIHKLCHLVPVLVVGTQLKIGLVERWVDVNMKRKMKRLVDLNMECSWDQGLIDILHFSIFCHNHRNVGKGCKFAQFDLIIEACESFLRHLDAFWGMYTGFGSPAPISIGVI